MDDTTSDHLMSAIEDRRRMKLIVTKKTNLFHRLSLRNDEENNSLLLKIPNESVQC